MSIEDFVIPWKNIYRASPAWLKRSLGQLYAFLPASVRFGGTFRSAQRMLDKSQWWSWEEHRQYQWRQLKALLSHAYQNVPYYRKRFAAAGIAPQDIRSIDHWQDLPFLTKDAVRRHKEELVAENMRRRRLVGNTGGSTGTPLELYWERGRTRPLERAFISRQWQWGGFKYGQRTAVLRGQSIAGRLWYYDPIDRQLFVNAYDLSDENCERMVWKLRKFRPLSIQAYPANLTVLANWMVRNNQPAIQHLKVLLCGSENLYPGQKDLFARVFQARVFSWYGHGEGCCLAGYCDQEDYYHVFSEYGYTELVDADGTVLPWTEGQRGEIVGTAFNNYTMPLIRYRTADIGVVGPGQTACGRNYRLLEKIEGRKQEYVVTADGRAIALTGMVFGQHWHAFSKIRKVQLEQREPGKVIVRLVKLPDFAQEDEAEIRKKIMDCVKTGLDVAFEYVGDIPLTRFGKHVFVKQHLNAPSAWAGDAGDRAQR